ncbi:MAG: hypothetical protein H5T70_14425, partial [Chloroflexi bacterium]|nr:hypothetical protein [Chloroflexota bacterium]
MKLPIEYTTSLVEVSRQATAVERETGVLQEDIAWLWPRLLSCRDQVLADVQNKKNGRPSPIFPEPVDSRFFDL